MSNFINNTCPLLESKINFISLSTEVPDCLQYLNETNFGILNITMCKKEETKIEVIKDEGIKQIKKLHVCFNIDSSGSMQDICVDGRTKMEHILFTLENMLRIFHEKEDIDISLHIQSFDTIVKNIVKNVKNIRDENIEELIKKIRTIRPSDSTNIELALKEASNLIKDINDKTEYVHIFLTDGEITQGTRDLEELKSIVPKGIKNVFIGYGRDHDSRVLSNLSKGKKNEYRFIDALEKAGLIYGEIIHGLFYKALEEVIINCIDCEIYNFETNEWTNKLEIGDLLYEQKKTYHIRSTNPETCKIEIVGGENIVQVVENKNENKTELINYLFRQKTQELLFEARKLSEENNLTMSRYLLEEEDEIAKMKNKLKKFLKSIIEYRKNNELQDDKFLKMLCDDIYIVNKTLGTKYGNMFSCARQTSQGRQQSYTCSEIQEEENDPMGRLKLKRSTHVRFTQLENDELVDMYKLSRDVLSPYSTDSQINMMRSVSGNDKVGLKNEEDFRNDL
jgi:hypothetical protein